VYSFWNSSSFGLDGIRRKRAKRNTAPQNSVIYHPQNSVIWFRTEMRSSLR
jgi:hypothetical protein